MTRNADAPLKADKSAKQNLLQIRCGDCLHFKGQPHPAYGKPCTMLGVKTFATAPSCYAPDVSSFRSLGVDIFKQLSLILVGMKPRHQRILMALLKSAGSLEKFKLSFLDKVYFKIGDEYLDNYISGYVLGVGPEKTIAVCGNFIFSDSKKPLVAYLLSTSVLSKEAFVKRRASLVKKGLLYAPKKAVKNTLLKPDSALEYEPPTSDMTPEQVEALNKKKKVKKKPAPTELRVDLDVEV